MPTTGALNGDASLFTLDGKEVAKITSYSLTMDENQIGVTNKQSGRWQENIGGTRNWEMSCEGIYDIGASDDGYAGAAELADAVVNGSEVAVVFEVATATDDDKFTGTARVSNVTVDSNHNEGITYSCTLTGTGTLTKTTVS